MSKFEEQVSKAIAEAAVEIAKLITEAYRAPAVRQDNDSDEAYLAAYKKCGTLAGMCKSLGVTEQTVLRNAKRLGIKFMGPGSAGDVEMLQRMPEKFNVPIAAEITCSSLSLLRQRIDRLLSRGLIVMYKSTTAEWYEKVRPIERDETPKTSEPAPAQSKVTLTNIQKERLAYLPNRFTQEKFCKMFNVKKSAASRYILNLEQLGVIKRAGKDGRNIVYEKCNQPQATNAEKQTKKKLTPLALVRILAENDGTCNYASFVRSAAHELNAREDEVTLLVSKHTFAPNASLSDDKPLTEYGKSDRIPYFYASTARAGVKYIHLSTAGKMYYAEKDGAKK